MGKWLLVISMLKLKVPADTEGHYICKRIKIRMDTWAPDRTLLHLFKGQTYKISFIAARKMVAMKIMLKDVKNMRSIYDSAETGGGWITIGKEPRVYTKLYTHNAETIMDVRLELDIGSKQQYSI